MSTILDVAKLAGVSVSTVSRVINGNHGAASAKTREKIWEAVRKTNYSANETARKLRKPEETDTTPKQSIDLIYARGIDYFIDPFFEELNKAMEQELFKHDYRLCAQYVIQEIGQHMRSDKQKKDAAIILGRIDEVMLEKVKSIYRHLIYVSLQDVDHGIDSVICRAYDSTVMATEYLVSQGHRKICYLGETENEQRYIGYLDVMKKYGFKPITVQSPFAPPGESYRAISHAFDNGMSCTAVLCANDVSTIGVYRAARERRLPIPKKLSVIGINDIENVRYLDPMLTTIHIPVDEMGTHAANLLIDRIEHKHTLPVRMYLPCSLVVRESCSTVKK